VGERERDEKTDALTGTGNDVGKRSERIA